jgi:hypothetical protein
MTECNQETFAFTVHFSRRVEAGFSAGQVSSDGFARGGAQDQLAGGWRAALSMADRRILPNTSKENMNDQTMAHGLSRVRRSISLSELPSLEYPRQSHCSPSLQNFLEV